MNALEYAYHRVYDYVDQMSITKTTAVGAAGSGTSFVTASIDPSFFDPGLMAAWFQVAAMGVGLLTGILSLALVWLKLVQSWKNGSSGSK